MVSHQLEAGGKHCSALELALEAGQGLADSDKAAKELLDATIGGDSLLGKELEAPDATIGGDSKLGLKESEALMQDLVTALALGKNPRGQEEQVEGQDISGPQKEECGKEEEEEKEDEEFEEFRYAKGEGAGDAAQCGAGAETSSQDGEKGEEWEVRGSGLGWW